MRKEEKLTELKVHMATLEHDGEFWAAVSPDANVEKIGSLVHKIVQKKEKIVNLLLFVTLAKMHIYSWRSSAMLASIIYALVFLQSVNKKNKIHCMVNSICEILKCFDQNDVTYNHFTSFNYANARYYFVNTGSSDQPNYQNILSIQLTVHRRILGLQL